MKWPDSSKMMLAFESAEVERVAEEEAEEEAAEEAPVDREERSASMAMRRPNSRSGILEAAEAACCIVVRVGMDSSYVRWSRAEGKSKTRTWRSGWEKVAKDSLVGAIVRDVGTDLDLLNSKSPVPDLYSKTPSGFSNPRSGFGDQYSTMPPSSQDTTQSYRSLKAMRCTTLRCSPWTA